MSDERKPTAHLMLDTWGKLWQFWSDDKGYGDWREVQHHSFGAPPGHTIGHSVTSSEYVDPCAMLDFRTKYGTFRDRPLVAPHGFRLVKVGEKIQSGDKVFVQFDNYHPVTTEWLDAKDYIDTPAKLHRAGQVVIWGFARKIEHPIASPGSV